MRSAVHCIVLALAVIGAGCKGHDFQPASKEKRAGEADSAFAVTRFDTIVWANAASRMEEGNEVFAERCRRCHGPVGQGVGETARADSLHVPSLVTPQWRYAEQPDSLRRRIFMGHYPEMRTWGIAGLAPRDIDAVAYYIANGLRPDALRGDTVTR